MKMNVGGVVQFIHQWGGDSATNRDVCRAVSYDSVRNEVLYMLETTSPSLRPDYDRYSRYSKDNTDILIISMRPGGDFVSGYNLNYDTASVSMGVGGHSFFVKDDFFIFGG